MIPVTKPYFPDIERYKSIVTRAYQNEWLTNRGILVCELEKKLQVLLNSESTPLLMNNGTIPLQIALKLLGQGGEIITTPFSYVATTSSILWEGCVPVFVDIDPEYLTIDETRIEEAITEKTTCILATHVFGNPCNVVEIDRIAEKYGLKVIYDAAHCFSVKYQGKSIFDWGDISTCSFHATKVFHTGEGGAAFVNTPGLYEAVFQCHNFGHNGPFDYARAGINGKMSELNAAMGHAVLDDFALIVNRRAEVCKLYDESLKFSPSFRKYALRPGTDWNYSYYGVIFEDAGVLQAVMNRLHELQIFPRRYFYPSLNTIGLFEKPVKMPVSEYISERILCLPVYHNLTGPEQMQIVEVINGLI